MTGAGSATVGVAAEPSYMGDPDLSTVDVYQPGKNVQIGEASLQRAISQLRDPDSAEPVGSIAQNVEGAFSAAWTMTTDQWHEWVFNANSATAFVWDRMPSTRWYLGVDWLDGTTERVPKGVACAGVQVQWQQGQDVRVNGTFIYGDEEKNSSVTPSNIVNSDPEDVRTFHDASLSVDNANVTKLNSFQLGLSPNARFQRGADAFPLDAVIGSVDHSLSMAATFDGDDQLELAYGGSGETSVQEHMTAVDATATFGNQAGDSTAYAIGGVKPDTYDWQDLVGADTDLSESVEYNVNSVEVV